MTKPRLKTKTWVAPADCAALRVLSVLSLLSVLVPGRRIVQRERNALERRVRAKP